jgi:hypothetical protein
LKNVRKDLKFNPKIGRIKIKRFMEFFLENSFTTVNILIQQKEEHAIWQCPKSLEETSYSTFNQECWQRRLVHIRQGSMRVIGHLSWISL